MDSPLDDIAEFIAVADAGGYSAAARRLGIAKSSLSESVARLEARLGARLLHRTTRRLALTEAGAVFHERGRRLLADAAEAEAELQVLGDEPRGQVRVTASVHFAAAHLAPLLPLLKARHPGLNVDLIASDEVVDLAGEGVDVAIRFVCHDAPGLVGRMLAPLRYLLCAAPAYLERRGVPARPEALREHECLLFRAAPDWNEWLFRQPAEAGNGLVKVRAEGSVVSDSGIVLREAAVAGIGIARLSTINAGAELRAGRLVPVLPDWPVAGLDDRALWALHPHRGTVPPKARAFAALLAERIGDPPYWDRGLPG